MPPYEACTTWGPTFSGPTVAPIGPGVPAATPVPATLIVRVPLWPAAGPAGTTLTVPGNVTFGAVTVVVVWIVTGGGGIGHGGGMASADGTRATRKARPAAAETAMLKGRRSDRAMVARSNLRRFGNRYAARPGDEEPRAGGAAARGPANDHSADNRQAMPTPSPAPRHLTGRERVI